VWDMETGEQVLGPLEGHTGTVSSVAISPDGRFIVSGSRDQTVRVWDLDAAIVMNSQNTRAYVGSAVVVDPRSAQLDLRAFSSKLLNEGGWLVGPRDELVLWVPQEYRTCFGMYPNIKIIGWPNVTADLHNSFHGTEWTKCYAPRSE